MNDKRDEAEFWGAVAACLLHPIRLQIVEAMLWIDRPLSAVELTGVFSDMDAMSSVSYHVRCLSRGRVLKVVRRRQVRGAMQTFYRLDPKPRSHGKRPPRKR